MDNQGLNQQFEPRASQQQSQQQHTVRSSQPVEREMPSKFEEAHTFQQAPQFSMNQEQQRFVSPDRMSQMQGGSGGGTAFFAQQQPNRFLQYQSGLQDYLVFCQPVPALFPERQQISLGRINQAEFETLFQLFAVNSQMQNAIEHHYKLLDQQNQANIFNQMHGGGSQSQMPKFQQPFGAEQQQDVFESAYANAQQSIFNQQQQSQPTENMPQAQSIFPFHHNSAPRQPYEFEDNMMNQIQARTSLQQHIQQQIQQNKLQQQYLQQTQQMPPQQFMMGMNSPNIQSMAQQYDQSGSLRKQVPPRSHSQPPQKSYADKGQQLPMRPPRNRNTSYNSFMRMQQTQSEQEQQKRVQEYVHGQVKDENPPPFQNEQAPIDAVNQIYYSELNCNEPMNVQNYSQFKPQGQNFVLQNVRPQFNEVADHDAGHQDLTNQLPSAMIDERAHFDPSNQNMRPLQGILKNKSPSKVKYIPGYVSRLRYLDTLNLIQIVNHRRKVCNFVLGIRPEVKGKDDQPLKMSSSSCKKSAKLPKVPQLKDQSQAKVVTQSVAEEKDKKPQPSPQREPVHDSKPRNEVVMRAPEGNAPEKPVPKVVEPKPSPERSRSTPPRVKEQVPTVTQQIREKPHQVNNALPLKPKTKEVPPPVVIVDQKKKQSTVQAPVVDKPMEDEQSSIKQQSPVKQIQEVNRRGATNKPAEIDEKQPVKNAEPITLLVKRKRSPGEMKTTKLEDPTVKSEQSTPPSHVKIKKNHAQSSKYVSISLDKSRVRKRQVMETQALGRSARFNKRQQIKERQYNEFLKAHLDLEDNLLDDEGEVPEPREQPQKSATRRQEKERSRVDNSKTTPPKQEMARTGRPRVERREMSGGRVAGRDATIKETKVGSPDQNTWSESSSSSSIQPFRGRRVVGGVRRSDRKRDLKLDLKAAAVEQKQKSRPQVVTRKLNRQNPQPILHTEPQPQVPEQQQQRQKKTEQNAAELTGVKRSKDEEVVGSAENGVKADMADLEKDELNSQSDQEVNLAKQLGQKGDIEIKSLRAVEPDQQLFEVEKYSKEAQILVQEGDEPPIYVSALTQEDFEIIHDEFQKEFLRTNDMHKRQPTYLVFHRFMYNRMKIKYPELQCYQLSMMVSDQWDKLSREQKETWRKNHIELLNKVNVGGGNNKESNSRNNSLPNEKMDNMYHPEPSIPKSKVNIYPVKQDESLPKPQEQEKKKKIEKENKKVEKVVVNERNRAHSTPKDNSQKNKQDQDNQSRTVSACSEDELKEQQIVEEKATELCPSPEQVNENQFQADDEYMKKQNHTEQHSETDQKMEAEHTQIPSKGNQTLNKSLTDENHMLDDDDWYTNMMKQIKDEAENERNEMNDVMAIINRPQNELYPDIEVEPIFRSFKVTTREPLKHLDHLRQSQNLLLWTKPPHCIYKSIKEYEDWERLNDLRQAFEEEKINNKKMNKAKFEDLTANTNKPMQKENGHWRVFARPDHVERVHLIELSDDQNSDNEEGRESQKKSSNKDQEMP